MEANRGTLRCTKCRTTFYGPRIVKNTGLTPSKHACDTFIRQLSAFKRRRKYHKYIPVNPIVLRGKTKATFTRMTEALEGFRCDLGLSLSVFYRLVSEFITVPSGVKYYPLREIFCDDSMAHEQFIVRLCDTLPWIVDVVGRDFSRSSELENITKFSSELSLRKVSMDMITFRSKDWYCLCAIKEMWPKKGWDKEEFLERVRRYYKRRMKKVTPEMVLSDLAHHELNGVNIKVKEVRRTQEQKRIERIRKPTHIDLIKKQDWYPEWEKEFRESINE